ncbi:CitMHS family transporter [Burkholderia pyrrocinia]
MLTAIGILIVLLVIVFLLTGKGAPIIGLILVPLIGAFVAGFNVEEIGGFYGKGLFKVMPVATMFIFAIMFFGVMQDVGLFRPLIRTMLALTRGNVVAVAIGTAVLGMVAHLDGVGATTFLLTIPALLPLYRKLRMSPYLMLMLLAIGAGVFNMTPWAGPMGRASAVTGIDVGVLWHPLIPVQIIGACLLVALAAFLGVREARRITSIQSSDSVNHGDILTGNSAIQEDESLLRPRLIWINCGIFIGVLLSLLTSILPAAYIFMIGLSLALALNYPSLSEQTDRIKAHAPNAMMMSAIILAAGTFLGIMDGSGILKAMAKSIVYVLPVEIVPYLHLILGVFGLPMELILSTDAYYFGLLPIVQEIVSAHGVPPEATVYALMIGNIIGTFISPFSPALWLALGLANLEMGRHIRYSFLWMWGFSILMLGGAIALKIMPIDI